MTDFDPVAFYHEQYMQHIAANGPLAFSHAFSLRALAAEVERRTLERAAALCRRLAGDNLCDARGLARGERGRDCANALSALAGGKGKP